MRSPQSRHLQGRAQAGSLMEKILKPSENLLPSGRSSSKFLRDTLLASQKFEVFPVSGASLQKGVLLAHAKQSVFYSYGILLGGSRHFSRRVNVAIKLLIQQKNKREHLTFLINSQRILYAEMSSKIGAEERGC